MALRDISPNVLNLRTQLSAAPFELTQVKGKKISKGIHIFDDTSKAGIASVSVDTTTDEQLTVLKGTIKLQQIELNKIRKENVLLKLSLNVARSEAEAIATTAVKSIVTPKKRRLALQDHEEDNSQYQQQQQQQNEQHHQHPETPVTPEGEVFVYSAVSTPACTPTRTCGSGSGGGGGGGGGGGSCGGSTASTPRTYTHIYTPERRSGSSSDSRTSAKANACLSPSVGMSNSSSDTNCSSNSPPLPFTTRPQKRAPFMPPPMPLPLPLRSDLCAADSSSTTPPHSDAKKARRQHHSSSPSEKGVTRTKEVRVIAETETETEPVRSRSLLHEPKKTNQQQQHLNSYDNNNSSSGRHRLQQQQQQQQRHHYDRNSNYVRAVIEAGARTIEYNDRLHNRQGNSSSSNIYSSNSSNSSGSGGTKRHQEELAEKEDGYFGDDCDADALGEHMSRLHMYNSPPSSADTSGETVSVSVSASEQQGLMPTPTPVSTRAFVPTRVKTAGRHISFDLNDEPTVPSRAPVNTNNTSGSSLRRHVHVVSAGAGTGAADMSGRANPINVPPPPTAAAATTVKATATASTIPTLARAKPLSSHELSEEDQFHQTLHQATSGAIRTALSYQQKPYNTLAAAGADADTTGALLSPVATQFSAYKSSSTIGSALSVNPTSTPSPCSAASDSKGSLSCSSASEQRSTRLSLSPSPSSSSHSSAVIDTIRTNVNNNISRTMVPLSDIPALQTKMNSWKEKYTTST